MDHQPELLNQLPPRSSGLAPITFRNPFMDLERIRIAQRHPVRISATIPAVVSAWLIREATVQGRSVSNLIALLLELAMHRSNQGIKDQERSA